MAGMRAAVLPESRGLTHHQIIALIRNEMGRVLVGQNSLIDRLLTALFTNGHVLLESVPGMAKTLTITSLAQALDLRFKRIQFTPDLMPSDLVGTMIYNQHEARFEVKRGPIFANLVLADELNRAPAKVQSALLEAMQEHQVTIGEQTFLLDDPFLVMATQNPIDQEGTYPLPEAQVDRFMLKVNIDYLDRENELEVMRRMADLGDRPMVKTVCTYEDVKEIRQAVNRVNISQALERYIIELVFATRRPQEYGLKDESRYIQFGASPRAGIALNRAAKALAYLNERDYVLPEDIKELASDVLSHRIILNYEAEADNISPRMLVDNILRKVIINK